MAGRGRADTPVRPYTGVWGCLQRSFYFASVRAHWSCFLGSVGVGSVRSYGGARTGARNEPLRPGRFLRSFR